jgi:hypothetical protein
MADEAQGDLLFKPQIYLCTKYHSLSVTCGKPDSEPNKSDGTHRTLKFENGVLMLGTQEDVADFEAALKHLQRHNPVVFNSIVKADNQQDVAAVSAFHDGAKRGTTQTITGVLTSDHLNMASAETAQLKVDQAAHAQNAASHGAFAALLAKGANNPAPRDVLDDNAKQV